jgi:2,5-dihydroxypyridine 5,6-dioxygenase
MTNGREKSLEADTIDHLLVSCGALEPGETVAVVADDVTADIAVLFAERAEKFGAKVTFCKMDAAGMHGAEPPPGVANAMFASRLIIGLTTMSLAHTAARKRATDNGSRYLSMPDYSWGLLSDPSLRVDFAAATNEVERVADILSKGRYIHVTAPGGTDIEIEIDGRLGNACPGTVPKPGMLGSPPDIEANVAPLENGSNGRVVVDGSIPCREIGLLKAPIELDVSDGRIISINGAREIVDTLEGMFLAAGEKSRVLAECGIGLNRAAKLQGNMLTDEGAFGCVHFGFGSNSTIGGANQIPFHLDFVFREASFSVDGTPVMKNGDFVV